MKFFQKYIYHILCTAVFALLVLAGIPYIAKTSDVSLFFDSAYGKQEITAYKADNGCSYLFIPAFVPMEELKFDIPYSKNVLLDGQELSNGDSCESIVPEREYLLSINGKTNTIIFYRSSAIASLFVDTVTGSIDRVHKDKEYEEQASLCLYSPDGTVDHYNQNATIKGRGHSSWDNDKKPYLIKFPEQVQLLNMSPAEKWVLIANAEDQSNLRNRIVFETANAVYPHFAPQNQYVDLYLNGEYAGLYLLTEKIASSPFLPEINVEQGDFLGSFDLAIRLEGQNNVFTTDRGRAVEIAAPSVFTDDGLVRMRSLVNDMEDAILTGTPETISTTLDLDSWVRRYLIDEIFANVDSDKASVYFYYSNGAFYAGPLWDYDISFGYNLGDNKSFSYPRTLVAQIVSLVSGNGYYWTLNKNDIFRERLSELYRDEFLPLLSELVDGGIEDQYSAIAASAKMNHIRWNQAGLEAIYDGMAYVSAMTDYLKEKQEFLTELWIEGKEFYHVNFCAPDGACVLFTSVEEGALADIRNIDTVNYIWTDDATGEIFDFSQPVLSDMLLNAVAKTSDTSASNTTEVVSSHGPEAYKKAFVIGSLAIFILLALLLVVIDIRFSFERTRRNDPTRTKVSSRT